MVPHAYALFRKMLRVLLSQAQQISPMEAAKHATDAHRQYMKISSTCHQKAKEICTRNAGGSRDLIESVFDATDMTEDIVLESEEESEAATPEEVGMALEQMIPNYHQTEHEKTTKRKQYEYLALMSSNGLDNILHTLIRHGHKIENETWSMKKEDKIIQIIETHGGVDLSSEEILAFTNQLDMQRLSKRKGGFNLFEKKSSRHKIYLCLKNGLLQRFKKTRKHKEDVGCPLREQKSDATSSLERPQPVDSVAKQKHAKKTSPTEIPANLTPKKNRGERGQKRSIDPKVASKKSKHGSDVKDVDDKIQKNRVHRYRSKQQCIEKNYDRVSTELKSKGLPVNDARIREECIKIYMNSTFHSPMNAFIHIERVQLWKIMEKNGEEIPKGREQKDKYIANAWKQKSEKGKQEYAGVTRQEADDKRLKGDKNRDPRIP